jgi:hypothetical protein
MRDSILTKIFRRVQVSDSEGRVLRAILSKANMYGKHARVAYECLAGITGFSVRHVKRLVKSLICERRLLRVEKRVLWYCHNAINVYHVVVPWRGEVSFEEMGTCLPTGKSGRAYPRQDRLNNKGNRSGIENLGLALQSRHGIPCHYGNIACPTARHLGADPT